MTDVFVSPDWLQDHLDDAGVAVVDMRQPFFFQQAHIPGARNLPVSYLVGPDGGPPSVESLANRLAGLGISSHTHVVAYDEGGGSSAARFYWVLSAYGHPAASILDGGVTAWRHAGFDWEYAQRGESQEAYTAGQRDDSVLARLDEMRAAVGDPDAVIVDTRSPAEYMGLRPTALHDGHIPGAVNVDWSVNFRKENGIALTEDPDALSRFYREAGVAPEKKVVVYCASGMRASQTFAVLKWLGYPRVAMYIPGWNEWGNRHDTPVEEE